MDSIGIGSSWENTRMSSLKEQYLEFLQLEDDLGLFQKKVGGIRFWELVRTEIILTLFERKANNVVLPAPRVKKIAKLFFYFRSLLDLSKNPFFCRKKEVLFSGGQRRVLSEDGKWWDIHVDPLIDSLGLSYMSLEYPVKLDHYAPAKTSVLRHFDVLITLGFLRRKLGLTKVDISDGGFQLLSQIRTEIVKRFKIDVNVRQVVINKLHERQSLLPLCVKLLKRIKPKLVVMVTSYARKSLVEACRILRIPTVELQHGVISPYHPGYSFPGSAFNEVSFPDYLLVFGNYWRSFAKYPIDRERIITVGYPYLEKKKRQYTRLKRKRQIVFISQNRLGTPISRLALELSKVSGFDYKIIYKLHPLECSQWRKRYPWLVGARMDVIDTLGTDLYKLLGESHAQVGVASTAVYEGLAFGLKTYLLDAPGVEYFEPLFNTNLLHIISSADDIVKLLESEDKQVSIDSHYLFAPNGVENTVRFLRTLLNGTSTTYQ